MAASSACLQSPPLQWTHPSGNSPETKATSQEIMVVTVAPQIGLDNMAASSACLQSPPLQWTHPPGNSPETKAQEIMVVTVAPQIGLDNMAVSKSSLTGSLPFNEPTHQAAHQRPKPPPRRTPRSQLWLRRLAQTVPLPAHGVEARAILYKEGRAYIISNTLQFKV